MKSKFTLFLFLLVFIEAAHAQMDEKYYFPDKQWLPIADSLDTENLFPTVDNDIPLR